MVGKGGEVFRERAALAGSLAQDQQHTQDGLTTVQRESAGITKVDLVDGVNGKESEDVAGGERDVYPQIYEALFTH